MTLRPAAVALLLALPVSFDAAARAVVVKPALADAPCEITHLRLTGADDREREIAMALRVRSVQMTAHAATPVDFITPKEKENARP